MLLIARVASSSRGSVLASGRLRAFEDRSTFYPADLDFLHLCMPRLPSVRRMLGPTQKQRGRPESRNYRNVTRGDEDGDGGGGGGDDDDRRRGKTVEGRKRAMEGGREKKVSLDEGDGRRSAAVSSGLAHVQCKIRPLILKRFANQPRHCSPVVKARDFLGAGGGG